MTHKFDPHFTEEQNRAYGLMLLREGFEQLVGENRTKAISLIEWHEKHNDLTEKQWWLANKLATAISVDKLDLNFASDAEVKPKLQAIVAKADKIIDFEHAKGKADMLHFTTGLDKAKQFAAAYGMGATKLGVPGSWTDNEIAAISVAHAPKKKGLSWAKALAKTPPGKPVVLGLDCAKGEGWSTLGDVASSLNLAAISPLPESDLQSTAGTKALTIAEAKTLILNVAGTDEKVSVEAHEAIEAAGGLNNVLVKAGLDPKLPPNDVFQYAVAKGDLITFYGKSHMASVTIASLEIKGSDHAAFVATQDHWDESYKTGLMTVEESHAQALEHYPPHGISPWQAKQYLLAMASPQPVMKKIGWSTLANLPDFNALLQIAKLGDKSSWSKDGWKPDSVAFNAATGKLDYMGEGQGYSIPIGDLKHSKLKPWTGKQLPYAEHQDFFGLVDPSLVYPGALAIYEPALAAHHLKGLASPHPTVKLKSFVAVNNAGGLNKVLAQAGCKLGIPAHETLNVERDHAGKKLVFMTMAGGVGHVYHVTMDDLHGIKAIAIPKMQLKTGSKPVLKFKTPSAAH